VIKSRRMRWAGHIAHIGVMRNVYNILVRKPEKKRPLRRPKHRWEDNIRLNLKEEVGRVQIGFIWLSIGKSSGLL
jgi:hypothetical protein